MTKLDQTMYLYELSEQKQQAIESALHNALHAEGLQGAELATAIQNGLYSRLCDLKDTIDITPYLAVTLDQNIVEVIEYLQSQDRNGSFTDMILEYENGDIDKDLIIEVCQNTLNDWIENHVVANDIKEIADLQNWLSKLEPHTCKVCGTVMTEGFVFEETGDTWCDEPCLRTEWTEQEQADAYDEDGGGLYWTEWED